MFGLEETVNDALEKIESGFEKLKTLAIANIVMSGAILIYMFFAKRK